MNTSRKYGRTFHLPLSPGATSDDKILSDLSVLEGASDLVVTEKMDGENTTIFSGGTHARSRDSGAHPSRDWMKAFAAGIAPQLDEGERIIGEYLYARHAVSYVALPSYFLGFAWSVDRIFQSWDQTVSRFTSLGIVPVPLLYRGPYQPDLFPDLAKSLDLTRQEGFVVRVAGAFDETCMPSHMGKYVREGHVQTETHWMTAEIVPNRLA